MKGPRFYAPCALCGARTEPKDRKDRRCPKCGGNPFTKRERVGQGLILVAFVLAAPALAVFALGMHLSEEL